MITLFGIPASASTAPRICLEEAGARYRFVPITRAPPGPPEFVASSPHGKVPALVDGDTVVTESAAVVMHLSERFPAAALAPPPDDPLRAAWYRWLMFLTADLQAPLYQVIYPQRFSPDRLMVGRVRHVAERTVTERLDEIEQWLDGREYLVGEHFTSADAFLWMLVPWTRHMVRPGFVRPHTQAWFERLMQRDSIARVVAWEGIV